MSKRYVVITGRPGIGKTTLFTRVLARLGSCGYRLTGFVCPEVREGGRRVGFRIKSIDGAAEAWLARVEGCNGPRIGRYFLCSEAVAVAEYALQKLPEADLIAIDEVGPMELRLAGIRRAIESMLGSGKPGMLVVHYRLSDTRIKPVLERYGYWFTVTLENRDKLVDEVYGTLLSILGGHGGCNQ